MTDDVRVYWADMTPTEQVMAEQVARLQVRAHAAEEAVERVLAKPYLNARPHGQPDPWREGYNQALREVRDTLMDRSHE
jgi:hypothetical protein